MAVNVICLTNVLFTFRIRAKQQLRQRIESDHFIADYNHKTIHINHSDSRLQTLRQWASSGRRHRPLSPCSAQTLPDRCFRPIRLSTHCCRLRHIIRWRTWKWYLLPTTRSVAWPSVRHRCHKTIWWVVRGITRSGVGKWWATRRPTLGALSQGLNKHIPDPYLTWLSVM